eukprot:gene8692-8873_t
MTLLTIERSATVGFCPVAAPFIAAGTAAGTVDISFSTSSVLEIFSLNFASGDASPVLSGAVPVPERFHRIAWGSKPSDATSLPYGLLAGGLADGSICLWNPAAIIDGSGQSSLLTKMQKHTGAVKGLEFNTFSPNLLASGAADGELCIWDVANPAQPSLYPALKGPAAVAAGAAAAPPEISYISWNRKVQHILASTQVDGATVVWDLKKQRPVITLKDPNSQRRCSVLQWNPDVATQLVVASDDDRSPTLQMWDLRNSMSPVKEFVGHTKGVLGMSWCQQDHSLLLSCSKDGRTICWDVSTTDVVCELTSHGHDNWNFDVQWSPTIPGVFSTSTFEGKVNINNILECTAGSAVETFNADFTVSTAPAGDVKPLKKPPNWLRRPVSVCCGFGGRLVSLANHKQQMTDPMTGQVRPVESATVTLSQVVTEHQLVEHSEAFEAAISGRDRAALQEFCASKAAVASHMGASDDAETWTFMGVLFEDDARRQLLQKLGFGEALMHAGGTGAAAADSSTHGVARKSSVGVAEQQLHSAMEQLNMADGKPMVEVPEEQDFFAQQDDPHGFFDSLPDQPSADVTAAAGFGATNSSSLVPTLSNGGALSEPPTPMADPNHVPEGAEREDEIQKAIFVGNYEGAVDTCLKTGRLADALLIANIGGNELFKKTMHRYMRRNPRPYMAVISAMVDGDYMSLVKTRPVGQWRETLAVLATYTGADQWASLCDALASRLAQTGMQHAASLCYICAGNVDQAVSYWSKAVRASGGSVEALQAVIEKSVVLGLATNTSAGSNSLADLVTTYANALATQGRMGAALRYLEMVPGEASTSVAVLKDRIYRSGASSVPSDIAAPPFPFQLEDIKASGLPSTPAAAQPSFTPAVPAANPALVPGAFTPAVPGPGSVGHMAASGVPMGSTAQQTAPKPVGFTPTASATVARPPAAAASAGSYGAAAGGPPMTSGPPGSMMPSAAAGPAGMAAAPGMSMAPGSLMGQGSVGGMMMQGQQQQAAAAPPAVPAGPPAHITMASADVSKVPADQKALLASLNNLFNACMPLANTPARKREMDDNSRRLGGLFWKLNEGQVAQHVVAKLMQMCAALDAGNWPAAQHIQVELTASDWDECGAWLTALKRLIKIRQTMG